MDGSVGTLNVVIGADVSGLEEGLNKAKEMSVRFGDTLTESFSGAAQKAGTWGNVMAGSVKDALPAVQSLNGAYGRLADRLQELGAAMQKSLKPMDLSSLVPADEVTDAVSEMWATATALMKAGGKVAVRAFDNGFAAGMRNSMAAALSDAAGKMAELVGLVTATNLNMPKIKIELDKNIKLPHFSVRGTLNAQTGSVPSVSVSWWDKGGLFTQPQIIGIAEKRPEFVGAAQDLRSFVGDAVQEAFRVRAYAAEVKPLARSGQRGAGGMVVTVKNEFHPREMTTAQMQYQAYQIRREIGRMTNI